MMNLNALKIDPEFQGKIPPLTFEELNQLEANILWCCTIKVDIGNLKSQYITKDKQEATKDGSESTKIQHGI